MGNYFFEKKGYRRQKGFDSFSKSANDILEFYYTKYPEVDSHYKTIAPLTRAFFEDIVFRDQPAELDTPFEQYILAFLFGMAGKYACAEKSFVHSLELLDDSFASVINSIFILIQLAQLYERMGLFSSALSTLKKVYREFNKNERLFAEVNNFYASCCVSMGLIYFKFYNNINIAGHLFAKSINIRLKFERNYPPQVCENYLSIAYRYKAITYNAKKLDRYLTFKKAFILRAWLLLNTKDEFTKCQFIHLTFDFLRFLISERYAVKYINKMANSVYKAIFSLNRASMAENESLLIQTALMLSKYYYLSDDYLKFFRWYALVKNIKKIFKADLNESFLNSESVYCLLKSP
jgi:hypothetical protein